VVAPGLVVPRQRVQLDLHRLLRAEARARHHLGGEGGGVGGGRVSERRSSRVVGARDPWLGAAVACAPEGILD
jgi:hypothetical protein